MFAWKPVNIYMNAIAPYIYTVYIWSYIMCRYGSNSISRDFSLEMSK